MFERVLRRLSTSVLLGTGVVVTVVMSAGTAVAAPAPTAGYAGEAYGTSVTVGSTVNSGPSGAVGLGCGTPAGYHGRNSVASVAAGALLNSGTVSTTADTGVSPTRAVTSARTQGLSLLGGLVTANAIQSVSTVTAGPAGYTTSAAGTTFTDLKVAGVAVAVNPAPNTTIPLLGLGRVVVNEQIASTTPTSGSLTVNGLHVVLNQVNLLGIGLGADIVVSHARSALSPPQSGFLDGVAYGSQVSVAGGVLTSGPSFPLAVPCTGTNGAVASNTGVGVNVPGVATSGTVVNTVRGTLTGNSAAVQTTSTIQSVTLLNGLITARGIKAVATATRTGGTTVVDGAGSTVAALTVNGVPVNLAAAPNTAIPIAGVGVLYLRRTLTTANQVEVRAIELDVTTGSVAGVPLGTTVYIGVARAAVL